MGKGSSLVFAFTLKIKQFKSKKQCAAWAVAQKA
jgi:hypothetical protein